MMKTCAKMTLSSVLTCLPTLKKLSRAKTAAKRKKILCKCDKKVFYSICEICRNVLEKNLPFSQQTIKKLARYKKYIRVLAKKSMIPLKTRKQIIIQKGGFLSNLLIPATAILENLITY